MSRDFHLKSPSQRHPIGLRAIEFLRAETDAGTLHYRKLRSFD